MILPALRKVLWFTALGWLTIVLIGPVLAVLGTILPFALVGGLVYLAWGFATRSAARFRLADVKSKLAENPVIPAVGRGVRQAFDQGIQKCKSALPVVRDGAGRAIREGLHQCNEIVPTLRARGRRLTERWATFLRAATRIGMEMVCGAVVGGLMAWYTVGQTEQAVAAGALIGAALGFVVGGPAREPVRETVQG